MSSDTDEDRQSPLFVDTSAFVAAYIEDDAHHEQASAVFDEIRTGESEFGRLCTTRYVLCETATVISIRANHEHATEVIDDILHSDTIRLVPVDSKTFVKATIGFTKNPDRGIGLFDCLSAVAANENSCPRMFTFDSDFDTLGFDLVPSTDE